MPLLKFQPSYYLTRFYLPQKEDKGFQNYLLNKDVCNGWEGHKECTKSVGLNMTKNITGNICVNGMIIIKGILQKTGFFLEVQ